MHQWFKIHKECRGTPAFTKPFKRLFAVWDVRRGKHHFQIDFILEPRTSLIETGWGLGCVGIEAKGSLDGNDGSAFGRAFAQILDYQTAQFQIAPKTAPQPLSMIFLLGPKRFYGTAASIMMQEGVGIVRIERTGPVKFLHGNGMHPILEIDGESPPRYRRPRFGMGSGHR
ncbi:MAG: hypothetical protein JSR82_03065 [Verrucomicrobia bacterium]|nr:hypothetical protein [Verrucomicrobiota bacterium]